MTSPSNPPVPPPIPAGPAATPAKSAGNSTLTIIIIAVVCTLALLVVGGGILAASLVPTVAKVRETARRTVDNSNLRLIGQASLYYAIVEGNGALPPVNIPPPDGSANDSEPATMEAIMALFAIHGAVPDQAVWRSVSDQARPLAISYDYVTGLNTSMSPMTPVAWTRGLREDGTWDGEAAVYGADGGHILFLGGNVTFFPDLKSRPLVGVDGEPTGNILETIPASARIVGSGPGSLHGRHGISPEPER